MAWAFNVPPPPGDQGMIQLTGRLGNFSCAKAGGPKRNNRTVTKTQPTSIFFFIISSSFPFFARVKQGLLLPLLPHRGLSSLSSSNPLGSFRAILVFSS